MTAAGRTSEPITATAKWLTGAAAGLAATSAAGLQFTGLGDARHAGVAIAAFVIALVAAALVIGFGARVLLPAYDTIAGLRDHELDVMTAKQSSAPGVGRSEMAQLAERDELFAFLHARWSETPSEVRDRLKQARSAATAATALAKAGHVATAVVAQRTAAAAGALDALGQARDQLDDMLDAANAFRARQRYRHLLAALTVAALLLAGSVPAFAWAISEADGPPRIEAPTAVIVTFANLPAELHTDECDPDSEFNALAVDGTFAEPTVRVPAQSGCRGAQVELTSSDAYQLAPSD